MTMFENVSIGDKLWSFVDGWVVVIEIKNPESTPYPLRVGCVNYCDINNKFTISTTAWFNLNGYANARDENPTLFWDEIKYEIPTQPKKPEKPEIFIP